MKERLLRIEAPHFVAGAIWQHDGQQWHCVHAAPIIKWMIGNDPERVAAYLRRKRWKFQWQQN